MDIKDSNTKCCTKCGEIKPTSEFGKHRNGLRARCKPCVSAASYAWNLANPEKVRANLAKWRAANREKSKSVSAAWRAANPGKVKSLSSRYYAENKEAHTLRNNIRRAREIGNGGALSKGLAERLYGIQRGRCTCCGKPLGKDYHLDHIMPLALGGTNTDDNMQLLRATCNRQKSAKHPVDFMQQRGFLL